MMEAVNIGNITFGEWAGSTRSNKHSYKYICTRNTYFKKLKCLNNWNLYETIYRIDSVCHLQIFSR